MAFELRLAPFPFHRSGYLFIHSRGAKKVGTELALLFYQPVPVPIYLFTGPPASPEREPGKKNVHVQEQNPGRVGKTPRSFGGLGGPQGTPQEGENAPSSLLPSALDSRNRIPAFLQGIMRP